MGSGKKKIEIKKIEKESRRMTTFSKRRKGLFKKAGELCSMAGAKAAILVISASGKPYPYGDIDAAVDAATLNSAKPYPYGDIDYATLNSGSNLQRSIGGSSSSSSDNGSKFGVSGDNNINTKMIKQWLNEDVENCNDLEKLLMLQKNLQCFRQARD